VILWRWVVAITGLCLPALAAAQGVTPAAPAPVCKTDPLAGRTLYLRGTFNSWNASEAQKFTWACNRWELVTPIEGEHAFKLGDEGWSADADFGARPGSSALERKGPEIKRRFAGMTRFTVAASSDAPILRIENCPAAAPFGTTVLYLRGTLNNWAALDDYAFQYSCDAYYLNIKASGRQEFKIADAAWKDATTFSDGGANYTATFDGEHTVRLVFADGKPRLSVGTKTFADPAVQAVSDPVALSLRFDSRDVAHKRPFGAVTAGTVVEFAVQSLPGLEALTLVVESRRMEGNQEVLEYAEVARVPMTKQAAADGRESWIGNHRFGAINIYGYWFEARRGGRLFALQNNTDAIFWTREKGSGGVAMVADAPASPRAIRRFRQTVYAADFKVPDWAPDIVYYYIFPDRFRNGDKANDPKPGRDRYASGTVELHANWNERPFKPGSGDGSDNTYNNDFFGGDLAGIVQKLDYIKALGANTIYMTPVFKAGSNHKYDTADYKRIDPAFGSNDDFVRLTREAGKRGIRIIPDTSLNHTGSDSLYFDRFGQFGNQGAFAGGKPNPASPYFDWYSFDTAQADPDKQYKGWVGVTDLPELNKASRSYREFAYGAKDSVTKHWLERGAAGWRMDVAPWVPDGFWREWRTAVKTTKPDALTVAETWFDSAKYLLGDMFDSTMNYIFRNTVLEYAAGGKARGLYQNIELMREAYPPQAFFAQMNLLSTHDQARSLHALGWSDDTHDAAVIERAKQRLKLAAFFQMTFPGAPTVYYGDEVGMTGGDDPYNRGTYPWADLGGKPDAAMLSTFRQLIRLRKEHPVLRRGSIEAPVFIDDQVIVLLRQFGGQWAITATNNGDLPRTVRIALPAAVRGGLLQDALTGARPGAVASDVVFTVPPMWGTVLLSKPTAQQAPP
jgi:cyclomaltodextrinase / maltogenic alpha-amylase / neopullulanase